MKSQEKSYFNVLMNHHLVTHVAVHATFVLSAYYMTDANN
jgi:hypothetical protein